MNWQHWVRPTIILAALFVAGCATTEPTQAPAAEPARSPAVVQTPATDSMVAVQASDENKGVIEALPAVGPAPTATAYAAPVDDPVVCTFERRTGSNRKIKICRRPQSALDEADTRQTFDSLRRTQIGEHR